MKKLFASIILTLTVIFCCVGMVGCNNGFKLVKSVSITTNGETKRFNSSTEPLFSLTSNNIITVEEYDEAPSDRKNYNISSELKELSKITINDAIKAAKNSTHYEVKEEELEGYWYSYTFNWENKQYYYFKCSYIKTYFDFVYVKVKNDTTVVIKKGNTETTYIVTSYNIIKF